jgi:hypothetical protein
MDLRIVQRWKMVSVTALAALGIAATSVPASAARTDYFSPSFNTNPACVQGDGLTVQPWIRGYPNFRNFVEAVVWDDYGAVTQSTYGKASQWCMRVDWTFDPAASSGTCHYDFYVPNDVNTYDRTGVGADATIVIGFYGPDGHTLVAHSDPLDESFASGYTPLTISHDANLSAAFTGINLGDRNGQSGGQQIGWGTAPANSLRRTCP